MKVLFRNYHSDENGKTILTYDWWKCDIKKSANNYFELVNPNTNTTERVYKTRVIKIKGDTRSKYVKCSNCGEIIVNNPEIIDKHYRKKESNINCLNCQYMEFKSGYSDCTLSNKIKINEDGTAVQNLKRTGYLYCNNAYERCNRALEMTSSYHCCKWKRCRNSQMVRAFNSDVFSEQPHFFDKLITEKQLINNGWLFCSTYDYGREYITSGTKNIIKAKTDLNGIVISFSVTVRNGIYDFMYVPNEQKPFLINGCLETYIAYQMSDTKLDTIKKKLNKLYEIEETENKNGGNK